MPLGECMRAHTHRQYLTWMAWFRKEWNQPNRSDYYLMQITQAIFSLPPMVWGKPPQEFKEGAFKIPFQFKKKEKPPVGALTKEKIAQVTAKMVETRWMQTVGAVRKIFPGRKRDKD